MTIGFIGNFEVPYTTENDRVWAFNRLGHDVVAFQENKVTTDDIKKELPRLDLLFYSHTHGWDIPHLRTLFKLCSDLSLPTVSVHLDRWAWLERESDVGKEATWDTQYLFMADGSPEASQLYSNRNWFYLPPGIDERSTYRAVPDPVRFPHDIVFVGSQHYHPEYPFRSQLVKFLFQFAAEKNLNFKLFDGGFRGHDLNVLYSTVPIVVGDSCFGNRPNYYSDRVMETIGRGGFLLHQKILSLPSGIMGNYNTLHTLSQVIPYFLERPKLRQKIADTGFKYMKENHTYTHRAQEILSTIYPNGTDKNQQ